VDLRRAVGLLAASATAALLAGGAAGSTYVRAATFDDARAAAVQYVLSRQQADGGFAEPGGSSSGVLTAWAVLGLRSAGVAPARLAGAGSFLARTNVDQGPTDAQLVLLARLSLGDRPTALIARVRGRGAGATLNADMWSVLALRAAGERAPPATVRRVRGAQARSGGWSWFARGAPDSNDTAAAVQALRAAGVRGRVIERGLAFLRRLRTASGGFRLLPKRAPDAQSTAWAVQAFVASGAPPPRRSLQYLARLQRIDGSIRYSARYVTTPVWVTAQALPALARKAFPLRPP
jgi:Prenyltransferase and squalene oxidase repeat